MPHCSEGKHEALRKAGSREIDGEVEISCEGTGPSRTIFVIIRVIGEPADVVPAFTIVEDETGECPLADVHQEEI